MWFGLAKIALQTGAKVYSNKQKQKEAMSQAALLTAEKMARGETEYQGKLLEARQNDYKDEFVLIILSAPIIVLAYAVFSDDPSMMQKIELFFHHFGNLPVWFQTLWITVVASIFGIKGTQIFKNGGMPITKSDFDPNCFGGQYQDPPETLHFQFEGVRCDNYVYRYVLVDKFRPNKIDSRSKKTEEENNLDHKQIVAKYKRCEHHQEVKPSFIDKIKKALF